MEYEGIAISGFIVQYEGIRVIVQYEGIRVIVQYEGITISGSWWSVKVLPYQGHRVIKAYWCCKFF